MSYIAVSSARITGGYKIFISFILFSLPPFLPICLFLSIYRLFLDNFLAFETEMQQEDTSLDLCFF